MFPFEEEDGGKIRIATLNVGTAKDHWEWILEKVKEHEIDVYIDKIKRIQRQDWKPEQDGKYLKQN